MIRFSKSDQIELSKEYFTKNSLKLVSETELPDGRIRFEVINEDTGFPSSYIMDSQNLYLVNKYAHNQKSVLELPKRSYFDEAMAAILGNKTK